MSAEFTLVRDENTSIPYFGIVVFSGGYDYVVDGGPIDPDSFSFSDPDRQIEMFVNTTGIEEKDLTIEEYKKISLIGLTGQGVAVDEWSEQKSRSAAKKYIKEILKNEHENAVSQSTRDFQALVVNISSEARLAGATYEDEETGAEDMDTDYLVRRLIEEIDPDGPDGWRIRHLINE